MKTMIDVFLGELLQELCIWRCNVTQPVAENSFFHYNFYVGRRLTWQVPDHELN